MTCRAPLVVALLLIVAAGPAIATQPESEIRTVRYWDLDLATPAGLATLHRRINTALETVCGSYLGATVEEADDIAACRAAASSRADAAVSVLQKMRAGAAFPY